MKKCRSPFEPPTHPFEVGDLLQVIPAAHGTHNQSKWMWTRHLKDYQTRIGPRGADEDLPVVVEENTACLVVGVKEGETIDDTWYYVVTPIGNLWTTGGGLEKIE